MTLNWVQLTLTENEQPMEKQRIQDLQTQLAAIPLGDSTDRADLLVQLARSIFMEDPTKAIDASGESLEISERLQYQKGIAYGLYHLGFGQYLKSDHEKAMGTLLKAKQAMAELGETNGMGLVLGALAGVNLSVGDYEKALSCSFIALNKHRESGDRNNEGWLLHGLGGGYHEMGDFSRAQEFHEQALALFEDIDLDVGRARALSGLGTVHQSRQDYKQALTFHHRSLKKFNEAGDEFGQSRALNDIGVILQEMGDFDQSREHLLRSLEIRERFGNKQAMSTCLINLGRLSLADGEETKALSYAQRALDIAEEIKARPRVFQANLVLSEIQSVLGNPEAALQHYKSYEQIKEQVTGDQAKLRMTNLQLGFEMEKAQQEAEISRLKNVELKEKNQQLKALLDELHTAQAQLIQSEKMAVLGSLVAGLLHEFNTPLGTISGSNDVSSRCLKRIHEVAADGHPEILSNKQFAKALKILERNHDVMEVATDRIGQITQSLKGFTKLDGSAVDYMDMNQSLTHTLTLLEYEFRNRVEVTCEFGEIPTLFTDPKAVSQVLMTLLKNAGEAISGTGIITVSTRIENQRIFVEIRDTGAGMAPETVKCLFEPSFSGQGERIKSGFGMMAAYNVLQNNGGGIEVESELGIGTCVRIWLPMREAWSQNDGVRGSQ